MGNEPTAAAIAAAMATIAQSERVLRAMVRDGQRAAPRLAPEWHAWALAELLARHEAWWERALPEATAVLVRLACADPAALAPGLTTEDVAAARATLFANGLATASELAGRDAEALAARATRRYRQRYG